MLPLIIVYFHCFILKLFADVDGDSCAPNPCAEGATCVDGVLEYICQCPEGKVGVNCERMYFSMFY